MKNVIKISMLSLGLLFSSVAFASASLHENEKAVCYIFKANKLSKKINCTYDGYVASGMDEHTHAVSYEYDFKIPNYGKVFIVGGTEFLNGDENRVIDKYLKLNSNNATEYYRNTSLKLISASQAEKGGKVLQCFKNKKLDFCYIDK